MKTNIASSWSSWKPTIGWVKSLVWSQVFWFNIRNRSWRLKRTNNKIISSLTFWFHWAKLIAWVAKEVKHVIIIVSQKDLNFVTVDVTVDEKMMEFYGKIARVICICNEIDKKIDEWNICQNVHVFKFTTFTICRIRCKVCRQE